MHLLCGAWKASVWRDCNGMLQTAYALWNLFPVSGHAGEYLPAFCFCAGACLLGPPFWTSPDGAGRGGNLLRDDSGVLMNGQQTVRCFQLDGSGNAETFYQGADTGHG